MPDVAEFEDKILQRVTVGPPLSARCRNPKTLWGGGPGGQEFLGYHFRQTATGKVILSLAEKTITNFENKLATLKDRAAKAQQVKARRQRKIPTSV